jgi:REP element-mobilizing transposase RayT
MNFTEDYTYHVYNRSNKTVFHTDENYEFFIKKIDKYISPYADFLAWCLLPNHFHFLIVPNASGVEYIDEKHRNQTQKLAKYIGVVLSSYSQAINNQENRKGSLFAHRTIAKVLNLQDNRYLENCFAYIHQNPCTAGLVNDMKDWRYSSYRDFMNPGMKSLVDIRLATEMVGFDLQNFSEWAGYVIDDQIVKGIF